MDPMDQIITLVDYNDHSRGYTTWRKGHFGKGLRHRGFVVLLRDSQGNVYQQKRKHRVFDGLWDLTAISHPYKVNGQAENLEEAALRSLRVEMGIGKVSLKNIGAFVYFAEDGAWCENEFCHVLVGEFDGRIKPNKKFVYDARKLPLDELERDIRKNSKNYTPWAIKSLPLIRGEKQFIDDLEVFKREFDKYCEKFFAAKKRAVSKYPKLIRDLYQELYEFGRGGKRLRPYLVWLGYRVAGGSEERPRSVLPVCLAVELFHNFLLIHDDIVDQSDTRRGRQTVHKKLGVNLAIILGDIACMEAFGLLSDLAVKDQIVKVLLETAYGEAMDIDYAGKQVKLGEIEKMTELKTARYSFVGPLMVGARLAQIQGVNPSKTQGLTLNLEKYGLAVGTAYQLQDDILGVFGDEKVIGKSVLSDMHEGKNTVLINMARKKVKEIDRIWGRIIESTEGNMKALRKVREIIEKSGARKKVEVRMQVEIKKAKQAVPKITKDEKWRTILMTLANWSITRNS